MTCETPFVPTDVIPLRKVTQDVVISFIQNHILHRFGIPETITTDQGSVFTGQKTVLFANQTTKMNLL